MRSEEGEDPLLVAIIAVADLEGRLLVAVPHSCWHRTTARRVLPSRPLTKAVAVEVPFQDRADDRHDPGKAKIWAFWLQNLKELSILRHLWSIQCWIITSSRGTSSACLWRLPWSTLHFSSSLLILQLVKARLLVAPILLTRGFQHWRRTCPSLLRV